MTKERKSLLRRIFVHPAAPLDPPPTDEELRWWETAKRPVRRKVMGLYFVIVMGPLMIRQYLTHPGMHHLLSIPGAAIVTFQLAIGVGAATLSWRSQRNRLFRHSLVMKRIRDGLSVPYDNADYDNSAPARDSANS